MAQDPIFKQPAVACSVPSLSTWQAEGTFQSVSLDMVDLCKELISILKMIDLQVLQDQLKWTTVIKYIIPCAVAVTTSTSSCQGSIPSCWPLTQLRSVKRTLNMKDTTGFWQGITGSLWWRSCRAACLAHSVNSRCGCSRHRVRRRLRADFWEIENSQKIMQQC